MTCVLITGATSGIGLQLATDYAKEGWSVLACGRNQSQLDELAIQYPNITPVAFDVTDAEQVHSSTGIIMGISKVFLSVNGVFTKPG